jgi:hypothetical protein
VEVPQAAYQSACWEGVQDRGTSGQYLQRTFAAARTEGEDAIVSDAMSERHRRGVAGDRRFPKHRGLISGNRSAIHVPFLEEHTRKVAL